MGKTLPAKGKKVIGWKRCWRLHPKSGHRILVIVKLEIPANAERLMATYHDGRRETPNYQKKCRASRAKVLEIRDMSRKLLPGPAFSCYANDFSYVKGRYVEPTQKFDTRDISCSYGIHFFLTKKQAEDY